MDGSLVEALILLLKALIKENDEASYIVKKNISVNSDISFDVEIKKHEKTNEQGKKSIFEKLLK